MPSYTRAFIIAPLVCGLLLAGPARATPADCSAESIDARADRAADRLSVFAPRLTGEVLGLGLRAFYRARCRGEIRRDILSVIDFSRPSWERRLWVFDLARKVLLFHERVAHGRGSGMTVPEQFSDRPSSLATSLGLFVTGGTYRGKHGYSLHIDGKEPGFNEHAAQRGVVIHSADYMTEQFVREHGRTGRSFGCPALDPGVSRQVIDSIKDGSALWAYYPEQRWLKSSRYLVDPAEDR